MVRKIDDDTNLGLRLLGVLVQFATGDGCVESSFGGVLSTQARVSALHVSLALPSRPTKQVFEETIGGSS